MNPRPRTIAVVILGIALVAETWLWIGVGDQPIGYTVERAEGLQSWSQFLMPSDWTLAQPVGLSVGRYDLTMDYRFADGRAVRLIEHASPTALVFAPQSREQIAALVADRQQWRESMTRSGVNALYAKVGRVGVTIEGALSYEELFAIARTLRPFSANWML
jgi:hypothetical protein